MNVIHLFRVLFAFMTLSIVEVGGGAVVEDDTDPAIEAEGDDTGDAQDDGDDAAGDAAEGEGDTTDAGDAGATDGNVVTIGDDPAAAEEDENRAPEWVRDLRKSNREKDRRIRELEQRDAARGQPQAVVVGEKPTFESCDYDDGKFETQLETWHTRKREADEQQRTRAAAEEDQRKNWQARVTAVDTASSTLKLQDAEDAVLAFEDMFSPVQRGIVMGGPDDAKASALLRYALGKNPKRAKELAAITDPVKFTFAVAKLETQLKVTPRRTAPAPDQQLRSGVAGAAAVGDNELTRLQAQADKTGDRSKVAAYLRKKNLARQAA